jgi:hypothetical protein
VEWGSGLKGRFRLLLETPAVGATVEAVGATVEAVGATVEAVGATVEAVGATVEGRGLRDCCKLCCEPKGWGLGF